jgi:excisionase family DNA binding protein
LEFQAGQVALNTTMEEPMPDFVSVKEAARLLGISRQRCQELIADGKLPALKLTGSKFWMVSEQDIVKRLRERTNARANLKSRRSQ